MNERQAASVGELIRETAQRIILPRFRRLASAEVREKGPGDFVTVVDTEAEIALSAGLRSILPGSLVVGEEAVSKRETDLGLLSTGACVWLVDPLDGTGNFVHGTPRFATMVALVDGGQTVAGWIFDPVADWMARVERGGGAWQDEKRLAVKAHMDTADGRRRVNRQLIRRLGAGNVPAGFESFTYRCAGQEYVSLASGDADYALYTRLMPWDHAAGVLLHHEAGGIGKLIDGRAFDVRSTIGPLLLTPDLSSWEFVCSRLPKH